MLELCGYMGSFSTACMETVLDQSTVRFVKNYSSFSSHKIINSLLHLIVNSSNVVDSWVILCLGNLPNVDGTV